VSRTENRDTGKNGVSIFGSFSYPYKTYVGIPKGDNPEPEFMDHDVLQTLIVTKSHKDGDLASLEKCAIEVKKLYPDEIETFAKIKRLKRQI
jgi:hypothetical protein